MCISRLFVWIRRKWHEHGIDTLVDTLASDPYLFAERCGLPREEVLETLKGQELLGSERGRIKENLQIDGFDRV